MPVCHYPLGGICRGAALWGAERGIAASLRRLGARWDAYDVGMRCNIDAKGKALRLVYGLVMLAAAGALAGLVLLEVVSGGWIWAAVAGLALMGGFGVFEARAGWCVVRAMGFKTRY